MHNTFIDFSQAVCAVRSPYLEGITDELTHAFLPPSLPIPRILRRSAALIGRSID